MKKGFKLIVCIVVLLSASNCTYNPFVEKEQIPEKKVEEKAVVIKEKPTIVVKRKKYKSIKNKKGRKNKNAEQLMADLRGVVSEDIYSQLEKTQAVNPIKGYNNINKKEESKESTKKDKTKPVKKAFNENDFVNAYQDTIITFIGKPNKMQRSQKMDLWLYKNEKCSAILYFYEDKCSYIKIKKYDANIKDKISCLKTFSL